MQGRFEGSFCEREQETGNERLCGELPTSPSLSHRHARQEALTARGCEAQGTYLHSLLTQRARCQPLNSSHSLTHLTAHCSGLDRGADGDGTVGAFDADKVLLALAALLAPARLLHPDPLPLPEQRVLALLRERAR
eukprot:3656711-Rhodomonas_salina.2